MRRLRGIAECIFYGVLPSPFYEDNPHYEFGYWRHLKINLAYAWRIARGTT